MAKFHDSKTIELPMPQLLELGSHQIFPIEHNDPFLAEWDDAVYESLASLDEIKALDFTSFSIFRCGYQLTATHNPITIFISYINEEESLFDRLDMVTRKGSAACALNVVFTIGGPIMHGQQKPIPVGARVSCLNNESSEGSSGTLGLPVLFEGAEKDMLYSLTCHHVVSHEAQPIQSSSHENTIQYPRDQEIAYINQHSRYPQRHYINGDQETKELDDRLSRCRMKVVASTGLQQTYEHSIKGLSERLKGVLDWALLKERISTKDASCTDIEMPDRLPEYIAVGCLQPQVATKLPQPNQTEVAIVGEILRQGDGVGRTGPAYLLLHGPINTGHGHFAGFVNGIRSYVKFKNHPERPASAEWCIVTHDPVRYAFSAPGHSGAVIIDQSGAVFGILVGGSNCLPHVSYFMPIHEALIHCQKSLDLDEPPSPDYRRLEVGIDAINRARSGG